MSLKNTPSGGGYMVRDRAWHPPVLTPPYKTSVKRSPQAALLSFPNQNGLSRLENHN